MSSRSSIPEPPRRLPDRVCVAVSGDAGVGYKVGYRNKIVVVDAKGRDLGYCDGSGGIERL